MPAPTQPPAPRHRLPRRLRLRPPGAGPAAPTAARQQPLRPATSTGACSATLRGSDQPRSGLLQLGLRRRDRPGSGATSWCSWARKTRDPNRSLAEKWSVSSERAHVDLQPAPGCQVPQRARISHPRTSSSPSIACATRLWAAATVELYSNMTDVAAPDANTVVFTLAKPNPDFLLDLGDYHATVIWSGIKDFQKEFIGTGPFMVESYSPDRPAGL